MLFSLFSLLFYFITIPLALIKDNKNFSLFLFFVLISFIFVILSSNSQNQDYNAYVAIFDNPYLYSEIGYVYLIELLKFLGFETHRSVLFSLSFLIVFTLFRLYRYSLNFSFFLILYIVFLFPLDVVQIRNTFAVFIFLNAILFFHEKHYIYFIITLILSVLFHSFAFIFSLLFFISLLLRGKKRYYKVFLFLFLFLFSMQFSSFLNIRNLSAYFSDGKISSVITWGTVVISFLIMVHYLVLGKKILDKVGNEKSLRLIYLFYYIILASIVFIPGLYLLFEFNRLYRLIFLIMIIFISSVFKYLNLSVKVIFIFYFLVVFSFFSFYYSNELNYDWILFGL